jgi:DNA-binding response OmpR family regulator
MPEIIIADDERILRESLRSLFTGEGFKVRLARDGREAVSKFIEKRPDVVLLDVMMPKANGYSALEEIRRRDKLVPVIFLTAKDADIDQLRGMEHGADDYISKSVSDEVLVCRVKRALERYDDMVSVTSSGRLIAIGPLTVDLTSLSVMNEGSEIAHLTRTECGILDVLHGAKGSVVSQDALIRRLRGVGFACEDGMLYVHISNLRKKLGPAGGMIESVKCEGYRLNLDRKENGR